MRMHLVLLCAALSLGACTTHIGESPRSKQLNTELDQWKRTMDAPRQDRVRITDMPHVGARIEIKEHQWLKDKRVSLIFNKDGKPVSAAALAQALKAKGINVMPTLPLEGYTYNGYGVTNVDGESALRLLFGPMGLDYDINDEGQYVAIVPNRARTFYLKFGDKKTKYKSGTMSGNVGSGDGSSSSGSNSSTSSSSGNGGQGGGIAGGVETGLDTGEGEISIESSFWKDLRDELDAMLTQCVPNAVAPVITTSSAMPAFPADMSGMPIGMQQMPMQPAPIPAVAGAGAGSSNLCSPQKVGNYSLNPSTGAVTIQAPHWVIDPIEKYLQNVKKDNEVTMLYEGMLIAVSTTKEKSEGVDIQGFASFASGKLGLVVNNNALGGVTVSPALPGSPPVVTPGGDTVGNTFLGIQKLTGNPAQAFLAYLEANSEFTVKQKPRVAATNGVPGEFAQYDSLYYNQIIQSAASGGTGGALVGTTNQLVQFKVGTLLRIVPYYDATTGYVRSPITFSQSVQTGSYDTTQYITGSDGETTQVPSRIPLIRDSNYAGEVLMKDGDMIILGGQVSESSESSGSGLPGYNAVGNVISGLMGQKTHKNMVSTYYLALTLKINGAK